MVKERPEEARNFLKGNFYFFLPLLWGSFGGFFLEGFGSPLFFAFCFLFYPLSFFIKISK
nr:hypothetical protein [Helicobacter pylori]